MNNWKTIWHLGSLMEEFQLQCQVVKMLRMLYYNNHLLIKQTNLFSRKNKILQDTAIKFLHSFNLGKAAIPNFKLMWQC